MSSLTVRRRITRQVMMLAAGLFLMIAAVDIIWLHQVSGPPEVDEETRQLTSRGLSQERTDYLWGALFLLAGAGLSTVAIAGLVSRAPVLIADDGTLRLRVAGPNGYIAIPWQDVRWVHSGSEGHDELVPTRVFLVHVADRSVYPSQLWGAEWDGGTLEVDADTWTIPTEEVVVRVRLILDTWRREHPMSAAQQDDVAGEGSTGAEERAPESALEVEAGTTWAAPTDDFDAPEEPVA